jgi:hydroxypyruvate reductase
VSAILPRLRSDADAILRAAIAGAEPGPRVASALALAPELPAASRVLLLAFGKAAAAMAEAALPAISGRLVGGLVVAPHGAPLLQVPGITFLTAAHPLPDHASVTAAAAARALLDSARAGDLVLALISGGGSSLLTDPAPPCTLDDIVRVTRELQHAGADIRALNAARSRMDRMKGGQLAALAYPAAVLCLALSDVLGDDPAVIASGPFTPPRGDRPATNVRYEIVASNAHARAAARNAAEALGYRAAEGSFRLEGEARSCGAHLAHAALTAASRSAHVHGGETTVTVRGQGSGGRNQEVALAAALQLAGTDDIVIGALGTDGIDGNSPAAGAIVDGTTAARLHDLGIAPAEALAENDSYTALQAIGDTIITGPTGTNVTDVALVLRG